MVILGIDPGFGRLGFGCLDVNRDALAMRECGCVETPKEKTQGERLLEIALELDRLIATHKPSVIGIEKLFFQKNVTTGLRVAEARGVVLVKAAAAGIRVVECSPADVKIAVTGYGNAEKKQVQQMVKVILRLKDVPKPDDAADAVAVAIAASRL